MPNITQKIHKYKYIDIMVLNYINAGRKRHRGNVGNKLQETLSKNTRQMWGTLQQDTNTQ